MNWYKHFMGDYHKDTAHLSMLEHGAYRLLLDHYYATEQPLPADSAALYRIVRAFDSAEQQAVDSVVNQFFSLQSDGYHNNRVDKEVLAYRQRAEINRRNAQRIASESLTESHSEPGSEKRATPDTRYQIPDTRDQKPVSKSKSEKGNGAKRPRFQKPSIKEIRDYCEEIGSDINPVTFFNHYETVGWKVGKNPMKDWKAAVRNWTSRNRQ